MTAAVLRHFLKTRLPLPGWILHIPSWTPAKSHKDCWASYLSPSPHETPEYYILIADKNEEYVCFSGMWWVPQNQLRKRLPLHNLEEVLGLQKILLCSFLDLH